MIKEKFIVCMGIFLILAVLTSCAFYYADNGSASVRNDMEITGRVISFGVNEGTALSAQSEDPAVSYTAALLG